VLVLAQLVDDASALGGDAHEAVDEAEDLEEAGGLQVLEAVAVVVLGELVLALVLGREVALEARAPLGLPLVAVVDGGQVRVALGVAAQVAAVETVLVHGARLGVSQQAPMVLPEPLEWHALRGGV